MLDFGHKLEAKATLAVWRVRTTNAPIVAEFAYQLKFDSPESVRRKQRDYPSSFTRTCNRGPQTGCSVEQPKPPFIYGYGNASLKHQE